MTCPSFSCLEMRSTIDGHAGVEEPLNLPPLELHCFVAHRLFLPWSGHHYFQLLYKCRSFLHGSESLCSLLSVLAVLHKYSLIPRVDTYSIIRKRKVLFLSPVLACFHSLLFGLEPQVHHWLKLSITSLYIVLWLATIISKTVLLRIYLPKSV